MAHGTVRSVGEGATRDVFGFAATLPHSAAHACAFTFSRTTANLCSTAGMPVEPRRRPRSHRVSTRTLGLTDRYLRGRAPRDLGVYIARRQ